ncbi:MAG TPA: cysteine peptidase family C39 domain-containing protein, partial [Planctomycetota bacterium]|nr:cysteine peptidase family C39 domain-containing protein [Planctomycetota bacterium]
LALLCACSGYLGSARDFDPTELDRDPGWRAVRHIPLIRQEGHADCGAAALAMVLAYWGRPLSVPEIASAGGAPGEALTAGALRDTARRQGLRAYVFSEAGFEDLEREVTAGRPVIVGLVKPHVTGGLTHYEVVAALHPGQGLIATLDPARGWRQNTYCGFMDEWDPAPARRLVIVVSP